MIPSCRIILLSAICFVFPFMLPADTPYGGKKLHRLGYLVHYSKYSNTSLERYFREYDTLAVTGYTVTASGSVRTDAPDFHRRVFGKYRKKAIPVLTLSSPANGIRVLADPERRAGCARQIADFLHRAGLAGVQFDFEYIPSEYNGHYGLLLAELRKAAPGLFISVCIAPQIDSVPKYAGFFDVRALDPYADEFMLMSYDFYGPLRSFGPVTDTGWSEANVRHILQHTRSEKIILGAPLYGYWWDGNGKARVITERQFCRKFREGMIIREKGGTVTLKNLKETRYRYLSVGDSGTVELFEEICRKYGLKGIGIWRLGFEAD